MASRGSVIPLFVDQVRSDAPLTITDPAMTRFMMSLDDAVDLVLFAFDKGRPGDIFVQKSPAATIGVLAKALVDVLGCPGHEVRVIGTRHGEKLYESLLSREERFAAEEFARYFRVPPDMRDLNYGKYIDEGEPRISDAEDYNSSNTELLDVDRMKELLMRQDFMQRIARGEAVSAED
jgi:UDP-glucose 4-epimerase